MSRRSRTRRPASMRDTPRKLATREWIVSPLSRTGARVSGGMSERRGTPGQPYEVAGQPADDGRDGRPPRLGECAVYEADTTAPLDDRHAICHGTERERQYVRLLCAHHPRRLTHRWFRPSKAHAAAHGHRATDGCRRPVPLARDAALQI